MKCVPFMHFNHKVLWAFVTKTLKMCLMVFFFCLAKSFEMKQNIYIYIYSTINCLLVCCMRVKIFNI